MKFQTSILRDIHKTHTMNCAKIHYQKTVERNATHLYINERYLYGCRSPAHMLNRTPASRL
jgi:capsule polysaccharide modification protein KpsS